MLKLLENHKNELIDLCQSHDVQRLYVFGSVLSEKFNENSDIDFLISFNDDLSVDQYTRNYFELHYKLREIFGREIDILTERTLANPYFIESVNHTKQLIYEA